MRKKISIFSFFSGIGILDLAFEKNGYTIVFVNEYDNLFMESYQYAREQMNRHTPIYGYHNDSAERYAKRRGKRNLINLVAREHEKGNLVGFIGGPPCPDFSVAGKNAGANGENGRLTNINLRLYNGLSSNELFPAHVRNIIPKQYHHSPMLIVEDDGCGMNDATLDDGFLKIATDIKSNEEGTLGEKGIGRLATQRLGTALLVETSSDKENHTSYVFIDWNDVINGTEEVPSFEGPVTSHHETLSVDPRKIQADSWQNNIGCGKIVYHYLERMHYE